MLYAEPAACGPKALALILSFEGLDQPAKWPGVGSGITLGHGFDLGFCTELEFGKAWAPHLTPRELAALRKVIGIKGLTAKREAPQLTIQRITPAMAEDVFFRCTLPKWRLLAATTFPGLQVLTPDQQGVLVSLVFNRGTALGGPRRREMHTIRVILGSSRTAAAMAKDIAGEIRAMTRLWPSDDGGTGHPGLRRRRGAEAALMEGSRMGWKPET